MIIQDTYKLKAEEQETIITYSRTDSLVTVYCSDRLQIRKFDKLCEQLPDTYKCIWTDNHIMGDGITQAKKYTFPKKLIKFAKPPKPLTNKQIEARKKNADKLKKS